MRQVLLPNHIAAQGFPAGTRLHDFSGLSMGTTWSVRIAHVDDAVIKNLQLAIQLQLDEVVAEMSHWEAQSCLGKFNRASEGTWHRLPDDFFGVLSYAMTVAENTAGAYDPTAGEMVNLWGFGPTGRFDEPGYVMPSIANIHAVLGSGDYRRLQLDEATHQALQPGGMHLDLSSVAKGFSVDKVAYYLEQCGIDNYLVEVGGELKGAGIKPDRQPWWVALEPPPLINDNDHFRPDEIVMALHHLAVATSGDYRRCFRMDGKLYPHTIDPRTGFPVSHGVASVTVVDASCMVADAVSTALTVMGLEHGAAYAEDHHIAARFLSRTDTGYSEHRSSQFEAMLS